jgi:hypothetical protein
LSCSRRPPMKMKFFSALTAAMLVALASTADAGQSLALSDHQMDSVTAGAAAVANVAGQAIGELDSVVVGQTLTKANVTGPAKFALAQAMVVAAATSAATSAQATNVDVTINNQGSNQGIQVGAVISVPATISSASASSAATVP